MITICLQIDSEEAPSRQLVILVGCASCSLLNAIAVVILVCYWLRRRSCLVFLKLQCCLSLLASMLVFIYALWDDLPPVRAVCTLLKLHPAST